MGEQADAVSDVPTATAVAAHLEALNLAGLAFAAKRMLGKDPTPVAGQFAMWARSGRQGLPALTEAFWTALSPLRIGRPSSTAAAVCDQVLVGREPDGAIGQRAAADGAREGKARFQAAPLPDAAGDGRAEVLRQRALVNAVKEYWRALGGVYADAREHVVAGDHEGAVRMLRTRDASLRDLVEQVAVLAAGVAGSDLAAVVQPAPAVGPDAIAPALADPDAAGPDAHPHAAPAPVQVAHGVHGVHGGTEAGVEAGVDTGALRLTDEQAEAFARREAVREPEPAPAPRPVEVLSTKPVRNHPFLPVVFLLLVSGVALFVLYSILNDPTNPLGP